MKTRYLSYSGALSRLVPVFILLASLLVLPKAHAAIGGSFTVDQFKFTVLSESKLTLEGTVSVEPISKEISGDIPFPPPFFIYNSGIQYSAILIPDYAFSDCTNLTSIEVPDSITSIGDMAFSGCTNLKSMEIPESITEIAVGAFRGCSGLTNIVIPESVTSVGDQAFSGCSSLTGIVIPDNITRIADGTFKECTNLTSIVIPDSVTSIGVYAFASCRNLKSVEIPEGITEIAVGAFLACSSLTGLEIPDSVTSIRDMAFSDCTNLTSIIIPKSVTSIGERAFAGCSNLTGIEIPEGVTEIGDWTFQGCSCLTSIIIPKSVTSIGERAFAGCSGLKSIEIPEGVTMIADGAFLTCSSLTSIIIPKSVTSIGERAFLDCSSLTSIIIPGSVIMIDGDAFYNCKNLKGVYFEGNAPSAYRSFSNPVTIYYRAGTTGWSNPWNGRPAALWIETPEITGQPQSQTVIEGDSVTFNASATGREPLSYQWYKEGVLIEGATGASYTIESVSAGDLGNYTLVVSNEFGEATSSVATLTLPQPYRATGTVQVVNSLVVGVTVTDGGWGYTRKPKFRIKDESGKGATGHCVIENGVITQIIVDNPGSNYSGEATLLIGSPFSNSSLRIGVSEVEVEINLVLGMEYQLWSSVDCINWERVGEPFTADEEEMTFHFKVADYGKYFKLQEI